MTILLAIVVGLHLCSLHFPASSAATNTLSPGQSLTGDDKLVSTNGKFALGFFETGSKSSGNHTLKYWYLGIWFNKVPKKTHVWIANRASPVTDSTSSHLTISPDGNLVILSRADNSKIWSSQANITANNTIAMLLDTGNLVIQNSSNPSHILWESFDHPTDVFLPGAKIGLNKITGLNRRIFSRRDLVDQSPGAYSMELGIKGGYQLVWNSSVEYWSSGEWNGRYFSRIPEMVLKSPHYTPFNFQIKFVNNDQEVYFTYSIHDESIPLYTVLEATGQRKALAWLHDAQGWQAVFTHPNDQCDVHATCGPYTVCNDNTFPSCSCMRGFSIASPDSWILEDRTGGCKRNTPLDCASRKSDIFNAIPAIRLPYKAHVIESVTSAGQCENFCLGNCSCTAYFFGNSSCSIWLGELVNVKQQIDDSTSGNGEFLHIRLAPGELQARKNNNGLIIGAVICASLATLGVLTLLLLLMIRRNRKKLYCHALNNIYAVNRVVPFKHSDLRRATKNFSEQIGAGGFGSVFKGLLNKSTPIAVKRLGSYCQVEKQFRAEVSSIGVIHHTNLVKLIGFSCKGDERLLVYEYMSNGSLDTHLFRSNNIATLTWSTRYQIALGVARGLAYLHESCRDCIIHCDIKPQNILLDGSFVPKIADFGMAKLLGRDFSRVVTTARGTIGYLAPEWISGMAITPKVDVYAYGMVLLELISGKMNSHRESISCADHIVYFPVEVAHKLLEGDVLSLVDGKLNGDVNAEEVERVCKLACWCIQENELDRPTMGKVVQILEGLVKLDLPPMPRLLQSIVENSWETRIQH
uniref:Receptor-like serine/threonine-protein kinase n=1 Tax=Leersia perrieri TaxID=77586 RepID=A0A0D9W4V1_9ORYZ